METGKWMSDVFSAMNWKPSVEQDILFFNSGHVDLMAKDPRVRICWANEKVGLGSVTLQDAATKVSCSASDYFKNSATSCANLTRSASYRKAGKPRAVLLETQVLEIYQYKVSNEAAGNQRITSPALAKKYGVGQKTIRDIWNGRTWFRETAQLSTETSIKEGKRRSTSRATDGPDDCKRRRTGEANQALSGTHHCTTRLPQEHVAATSSSAPPRANMRAASAAANPDTAAAHAGGVQGAGSGWPATAAVDCNGGCTDDCNDDGNNDGPPPSQRRPGHSTFRAADIDRLISDWDSDNSLPAHPLAAAIASPSAAFEDPFHDDWPSWRDDCLSRQ